MGHGRGFCTICPGVTKTCNHIFFTCHGWAQNAIFYITYPKESTLTCATSFVDILDGGLDKTPPRTTYAFVVYQTCWNLWLHHNQHVFNYKFPNISPRPLVNRQHHILKLLCNTLTCTRSGGKCILSVNTSDLTSR